MSVTAPTLDPILDLESRPIERPMRRKHGVHVLRAEYVLAERDVLPLRMTGDEEDRLLAAFAKVQQEVRRDWGESVEIALDVLPLSPAQMDKVRRKMLGKEHEEERSDNLMVIRDKKDRGNPAERVQRSGVQEALRAKFGGNPPPALMRFQLLVRVRVPYELGDRKRKALAKARAKDHMKGVNTALRGLRGRNYLRVVGLPIFGSVFAGSDALWRSWWFDYRMDTGYFRPARRNLVSARELAPMLRPPTKANPASNILRSGGLVPPAPRSLPQWESGSKEVIPLGKVRDSEGRRMVGLPQKESLFDITTGRSGFGKTELGMGQFVSVTVDMGYGGMFIDPHADALARLKEFMGDPQVARRVVEINFAGMGQKKQPGWNPLSMEGLGPEHIGMKVQAIRDSIAAAMHWHVGTNQRALNLTGQAAKGLIELNRMLPPELQATIFQIPTLLDNDLWREEVSKYLSPDLRAFFGSRFGKIESADKGAITPITNLMDDMRLSPAMVALMGQSKNTFDSRKAMDEGKIVLLCPGSGSAVSKLVANFLVYDLIRAAISREDIAVDQRRLFYLFLDELQSYDKGDEGNIAAVLEQTRKFGLRAWAFTQDPGRLAQVTLAALLANRSHLITTTLRYGAAKMLTPEFGRIQPETITEIPKWNYIAQVETGVRGRTAPFRVQGVAIDEMHASHHREDLVDSLDATVDLTTGRKAYSDVAPHLAVLDDEILHYLRSEVAKPTEERRQTVPPAERAEVRREALPRPEWRQDGKNGHRGRQSRDQIDFLEEDE